ncbi:MAG: ABC transporter permease [Clostridia bacterium]|nr:ABC transporter permease [Clostridia bacterium]
MINMKKRTAIKPSQSILIRVTAVILAFITSSLFIALMGHNPLSVYSSMFDGAFGTHYRIIETLKVAIPIILASIGIMIAFKMKFWNIGGEGQILMGAFMATFFALQFDHLPKPLLLFFMFIGGFVGGGLWALIPAYFKEKYDTNETIITLMLNYIALKWITYLQYGPWKDPAAKGFPKIANFSDQAILPKLFDLHIGWIITLAIVIIISAMMKYSKWGYYITVIGESRDTARYSGINIKKTVISAVFISGGICGLVGFIQASAVEQTLSVGLSAGYGFTAIITTWLSALIPMIIIPASILFAALVKGGSFIQTAFQIPNSAAEVLQSMILFFVIGSEFFAKYTLAWHKKERSIK